MAKRKKQLTMVADRYVLASQQDRLPELQALGFKSGLLTLAGNRKPPSLFADLCRKPWMIYVAGSIPIGPRVVPMWESVSGGTTIARRQVDGNVEIIEYDMESPEDVTIVAHHEQGILAHCFIKAIDLAVTCEPEKHELDSELKELKKLAKRLEFSYFSDVVDLVGKGNPKQKDCLAYTRNAR